MTDNLTPQQRRYCMSRIKGKDTGLEKIIRAELRKHGLRFKKYPRDLPGKPDIVFPEQKVAVFVDGDFWHGYRLPQWERKLSSFWRNKIRKNRERDRKNFAKLRRRGWRVIRIWKHTIQRNLSMAVEKIREAVE